MKRHTVCGLLVLGLSCVIAVALLPGEPVKQPPGAMVFHERGCEQCHGASGIGTAKGPDLRGVGRRLKRADLDRQIRDGGQGMPAFGDVLEPAEIDELDDWLVTLKARSR